MGYDTQGNIRQFDQDGDLSSGPKMNSVVFLNFSRLLVKDEIKKGSFVFDYDSGVNYGLTGAAGTSPVSNTAVRIQDVGAASSYKVNSPAGEYGILSASNLVGTTLSTKIDHGNVGLIFYQAGIVALTSSLFMGSGSSGLPASQIDHGADGLHLSLNTVGLGQGRSMEFSDIDFLAPGNPPHDIQGPKTINAAAVSGTINQIADGLRHRIRNVSFNNTTELNSSIYFCRANHNEFNYSSNPTYLNGSKIQVKGNDVTAPPKSYVTTVGLYSADNELLAVAKLSEPLRKDPTNELTLRVRLDY